MKRKHEDKRVISLLLAPMIVVGALSGVSFGQQNQSPSYSWEIDVQGELLADGVIGEETAPSLLLTATPSSSIATAATAAEADEASPQLGQAIAPETTAVTSMVVVDWMQVTADDRLLFHSNEPGYRPEEGFETLDSQRVETRVKVTIPSAPSLGAGDEVTWVVGKIPGLNLPSEDTEAVVLNGILIGYASLRYAPDGTISIHNTFTDGTSHFNIIYITYTYEAGWVPVNERVPVEIQLGNWDQGQIIYVLPAQGPIEPSTPEETTPEESSIPEETTPPEESSTSAESEPTEESTTSGETESSEESSAPEESTGKPEPTSPSESKEPEESKGTARGGSSKISFSQKVPDSLPNLLKETEFSSEDLVEDLKSATEVTWEQETLQVVLDQQESLPTKQQPSATPVIEVKTIDTSDVVIDPGSNITYEIQIKNESQEPIENLRIRNYLPEHTSFVEKDSSGVYGIIAGQQQVTWNIDRIEAGETQYCRLTVKVFVCTPEQYKIINRVYYQSDDKAAVNDPRDPEFEAVTSSLIVG